MYAHLQSYLRTNISTSAVRVGPFWVTFDEHDDNVFLNYAIPDDGAVPTAGEIAGLVTEFRARARAPRLEYVSSPEVDAALSAAGFIVDNQMPLLAVSPVQLRPAAPAAGCEVAPAVSDADLWVVAGVLDMVYGGTDATRGTFDRMRSTVDRGGMVVLARYGSAPVGGGAFSPPRDGLSLLWGVGVLAEYRRRGIAAAVGELLTRHAHAAGATPFLEVEGPAERRLYERLGYRQVGVLTTISLPERIPAGHLVLEPVGVQRARNILAGDLSGLTLGERWPHPGTLDGLRMVAECQAGLVPDSQPQAWLVLLDGVVIGECGTSGQANEAGDIEIGYGLAEPYRGRGFGAEMLAALSRWLVAQDGVHRVTVGDVRTDEVPSFVGRRLAVQAIDPARALATGLPSSAGCR